MKSFRARVVDRTPLPCLTNAHELFVAVAAVAIGVWLTFGNLNPTSVDQQAPTLLEYGWGLMLLAGAACTIVGLFTYRPRVEWLGQNLLGWACAFYAVAVATNSPLSAGGVIVVFFALLALASWWRAWRITSTPYVQHRIERAARTMRHKGETR